MPWSPYSPDLNPIEHVWDSIDRAVRQRADKLRELADALIQKWDALTQININKLVEPSPDALLLSSRHDMGYTRYCVSRTFGGAHFWVGALK